ncbi:MAG: glycosyltransferase family 2 protein [Prevotella sp.]|nr:glycosyltransferase family 2 protein [Prevotella sp.]
MFFSFVLPAYKGRFLSESIQSILNQTYEDFELVVVDDCSPEPIRNIVSQFNDNRITYYRNDENIGGKDLVAQWNYCLTHAKGDYVILATDDDIYEPTFLSEFYSLIKKYPKVSVFRSRIIDINGDGNILWFDRCYKEFLNQGEFFYCFFQGMKGGIPQFLFKKDDLIKNGGFFRLPIAWGSDDATALMLSQNGLVNSQDLLVRFRWSDINISNEHNRDITRLKIKARIKLCKWLEKEIDNVKFDNSEIGNYCRDYVIGGKNVHFKQILLKELKNVGLLDFLPLLEVVRKGRLLSNRDLFSLVYRYLKARFL